MRKIIFTTLSLLLLGLYSNAQNCTPVSDLPPDFVGVYPTAELFLPCDTLIPAETAHVNCPYEYTFSVFAPTEIPSGGIMLPINSIVVNSVEGLPPGLSYVCEPSSCVYPAGQVGCMKVMGTPDANIALGDYPLTISATVNVGGFFPFPLDVTFPPDPNNNSLGLPECPYTIRVEADNCTPVACEAPASTHVEMTTATNAVFTWSSVPSASFYQVKYRLKGTTPWLTVGSGSPQRSVSGLTAKKYYQYKVRAQCGDEWSDFSDIGLFYTSACDEPTGVSVTFSDDTRMRVRWDNNPDEIKGKIRYRAVGITNWVTQNSQDGNNFLWVNGLPSGATIQYKVRSNCDGNDWSAYSPLYTHTLPSARLSQAGTNEAIKLYPNPARDILNIEFETMDAEEVNITISNNLGEAVHIFNNNYSEGVQRETVDMRGLSNGYYFVTIRSGEKVETQKFMKMN